MPPLSLFLFAQVANPIPGYEGWAGAGLLGLVLAWLFFWHLPAKDKQITDLVGEMTKLVEKKDADAKDLVEKHDRRVDAMQVTFKESLQKVVDHCQSESEKLAETIKKVLLRQPDKEK
jgi:hypothetical protein